MRLRLHVFLALLPVCVLGRGIGGSPSLRSQQIASPSPAEVEEQEETEGTQEQDVATIPREQQSPQQNNFMQLPPRPVAQGAATEEFLQSAESRTAPPESAVPSLPSLIADGVAGPSLPQGSVARDDAVTHLWEQLSGPEHDSNMPKASTTHISLTVPSVASRRSKGGDVESASAPFPTLRPIVVPGPNSSALTGGTALQADPSAGFEPTSNSHSKSCNPPCQAGRGVCNDNVCWCKTPYTGSTCQHKVGELQRVATIFVVAFSLICIILGVFLAQGVHSLIVRYLENKMRRLGKGMKRDEVWASPEGGKGKARGHAEGAHDHEVAED